MDLPPFYAGQQVIVLKTVSKKGVVLLTKNETRVVRDIKKNTCKSFPWIVNVGAEGSGFWKCPLCQDTKKQGNGCTWFESDLFMGIDSLQTVTFEKITKEIPIGVS